MEKSVLLVDDKQEIAKIIMLYLSSTYKVSYKENPLKAIAWLQEGNLPDLIISDLNMPEMSGEEFLVYLKANDICDNRCSSGSGSASHTTGNEYHIRTFH